MILYVKNMLSERCKLYVEKHLQEVGLSYRFVDHGVIDISRGWTEDQKEELEARLREGGLEIKINRKVSIVQRTEEAIKQLIDSMNESSKCVLSEYLSKKLNMDYSLLSKIFSEQQGLTIQQYCIFTKVEKVMELLQNDSLTMTDIAYRLQYSSIAHLSNQFKKVTGHSPTDFRKLRQTQAIEPLALMYNAFRIPS